jgi:hypothetical protein
MASDSEKLAHLAGKSFLKPVVSSLRQVAEVPVEVEVNELDKFELRLIQLLIEKLESR